MHVDAEVSYRHKNRLDKELEPLKRLDVIEATREPSEWMSALAVTHKQNGDLRVCIDPRGLNKALQRVQHPVPTVRNLWAKLQMPKYSVSVMFATESGTQSLSMSEVAELLFLHRSGATVGSGCLCD